MVRQHKVNLTLIEDAEEPWLVTSASLDNENNEIVNVIVGGLQVRTGDIEAALIKFLKGLVEASHGKEKKCRRSARRKESAERIDTMVEAATISVAAKAP